VATSWDWRDLAIAWPSDCTRLVSAWNWIRHRFCASRAKECAADFTKRGDDNRKLCSLYLGIMDRMGIKLDTFGDADSRLEGL
jgi:hypothetical protein